jgi:Bacteriocin-protection, YdeI or OmpD-Associated/Domain of unknown function (DUF1905)
LAAHRFKAELQIIGINPYVSVPEQILQAIFRQAGRDKGPIPICGTINKGNYRQTLVRYRGEWRLYINTVMLTNSPGRIGETITISVAHDTEDRTIAPHPKLLQALAQHKEARAAFDSLSPYRRKEIVRYIANLRTEESVVRNVARAIAHLLGRERFVGRDSAGRP